MRTRFVIGSLVASMMTFQVLAQRAENDDMYFTSKDREKLKAENASMSVNTKIDNDYKAFKKKHFDKEEETAIIDADTVNPTDSYSARNVNPEYVSRSNSEQASEDESYYVEGYAPNTYSNPQSYDNYSSNGYNNWNNNNWNNPYNSWNNPYNNCFSCSNLWNPYYGGSGLSVSIGYGWGSMYNPWNYGMGYGSYYNPYAYGGYYSPYYGYGSPYYGGGYETRRVNYGKRPSRHSAVVTPTPRTGQRGNVVSNGRTSERSREVSNESYVRPTRRTNSTGTIDRTTDRSRSNSFDYNRSRTREYSAPRESRPSYTPSRSSSSPSRSSGSSSGSRRGGRD